MGAVEWPKGNQIFGVDLISSEAATGLPFPVGAQRAAAYERKLFYAFETE
jgi:hypothetical protein